MAISRLVKQGKAAESNFCLLGDTKQLGLLTRSLWDSEVQATHYHTIRGSELTGNKEFVCLMGGGMRAQAVQVDPTTRFKRSAAKKQLPTIKGFLNCKNPADVQNLTLCDGQVEDHVYYYAVLPPFLLHETFNEENLSAANILFKFICAIKAFELEAFLSAEKTMAEEGKRDSENDSEREDDDDFEKVPETAKKAEEERQTKAATPTALDLIESEMDAKFGRTLLFFGP